MKKSKIILTCLCIVLLVTGVIFLRPERPEDPPQASIPQDHAYADAVPTETVDPGYINDGLQIDPNADPHIPSIPPASDFQNIELGDGVTISQVPADPNEVIRYGEPILEGDPEYLDIAGGDLYASVEGKVYRNDKTISIVLYDEMNGENINVSFGYPTGELNRFLYLNPVITGEHDYNKYGCRFYTTTRGGGGLVTNLSSPINMQTDDGYDRYMATQNYQVYDSLDLCADANYAGPTQPGSVWYTEGPMEGGCYVYVSVYCMSGDFVGILRLTIAKAEDKTYSIVNLENMNLLQTYDREDSLFSRSELQYIYDMALADINGGEKLDAKVSKKQDARIEECLMNYHDQFNGLYLPYYIPREDSGAWKASSMDALYNPVVSITFRHWATTPHCLTLYYSIMKEPTEDEHGEYYYLGNDYRNYTSLNNLINQGYPLN